MKKLLFLILFCISSLHALDERMVDVYYGNGVWNTPEAARASAEKLNEIILSKLKLEFLGKVDVAYNWTHGEFDDVVETVFQLQEEGQLNVGFFVAVGAIGVFSPSNPYLQSLILGTTAESIIQAMTTEEKDIKLLCNNIDYTFKTIG